MARARNIKPGFFTNELLGVADPMVCLTFAGLWCLADKNGVLEDRPLRIKAELFPYRDGVDVNGYLTVLTRLGFIVRYTNGGLAFIQVCNFRKHQSPHHTEKAKGYPEASDPNSLIQADNRYVTVQSPCNDGESQVPTRSDSLIPDSLIPDSLIDSPPVSAGQPACAVSKFDVFDCPNSINREAWREWVEFRRKARKPISEKAAIAQWRALYELPHEQQADCIALSIRNDWQGLFPEKLTSAPKTGVRGRTILEDLTDTSWAQ